MTSSVKPQSRLTRWGDRLGRWNPQLLRQLRGLLSPRTAIFAIVVSFTLQLLVGLSILVSVDDLIAPNPTDPQISLPPAIAQTLDRCLIQFVDNRKADEPAWSEKAAIEQCSTGQLQTPEVVKAIKRSPAGLKRRYYCTGSSDPLYQGRSPLCVPDGNGAYQVNWRSLFGDSLPFARGFFLMVMAIGGSYAIAQSWIREAKLGTLDFIRMSPEPAGRILFGKIMGAPILCYIAALAWIPFHLFLALNSDVAVVDWITADIFGLAALSTVFVGALAACVWTGGLNLSLLLLTLFPMGCGAWLLALVTLSMQESTFPWGLMWFGIDLIAESPLPLGLGTAAAIALIPVLWKSACRRFDSPQITPLSRRQAYQLMIGFNGLALGFGVPVTTHAVNSSTVLTGWAIIGTFWMVLQTSSVWATMPQRQELLDWSRYRHMHPNRRDRLTQWIFRDQSPCLAVPLVNLGITWVMWSPWALHMLLSHNLADGFVLLLGLTIPTALLITVAALGTWCFLSISYKPQGWMTRALFAYVVVSVIALIYYAGTYSHTDPSFWWPILLTSFGTPFLVSMVQQLHTLTHLAMAGLLSILGAITTVAIAQRTLLKTGTSEMQALLGKH